MLNKLKSFLGAQVAKEAGQVEQGAEVKEEVVEEAEKVQAEETAPEFDVEGVMDEMIANGEVIEDISFMESMALDVMGVLKHVPIMFKNIMNAKPEDAYSEVRRAVNYLSHFDNLDEKINRDGAYRIIMDFKQLMLEIESQEVTTMQKIKTLLSALLYEAGMFIINTGLFVMDTVGIITIFALRMAGHLGRETMWACKEIGKSFNHRMIEPYKNKEN